MARVIDILRNSPSVMKRKISGGSYKVLESENKDPFAKGINFNVQYFASAEVQDRESTPAVQQIISEVCAEARKNSKPLRKVRFTVKAQTLIVTDSATKVADTYPIFLVAYCGGHGELEDIFFFIHKTKLEGSLRVEVFRCSTAEKVKAIILTVAKAFNISYKAWTMEKKKKEKMEATGSESPAVKRKVLAKMAPGVVSGGTYTPPAPRKPPNVQETTKRGRSGSFGDDPAVVKPAVVRGVAHNEVTGSMHNVTLTDDFDKEFQLLAESRVQPSILRTSLIMEETDSFNLDSIKDYIDKELATD